MKFDMSCVSRGLHRTGLSIQKHSPEILLGVGIIGFVGTVVTACMATTKLDDICKEGKAEQEKITNYVEENGYSEEYTEEDKRKDIAIVKTHTALKIAKVYAPAVLIGGVSIAAFCMSDGILTKRNAALTAAYAGLATTFKEYRGRVSDRLGEEVERDIRFNRIHEEVEEEVKDEEGNVTTKKIEKDYYSPNEVDDTARFFDEFCTGWTKDPELNLYFLRMQQDHANELLRSRGHLFLNEVYEMLGISKTKRGQIEGWVYDPNNEEIDNFVDFGIYNGSTGSRDFVNGRERSILLNFNVQGVIWDLLE